MEYGFFTVKDYNEYIAVVNFVIAEGKYLQLSRPIDAEFAKPYVLPKAQDRYPLVIAKDDGKVVGWCEVTPEHNKPKALWQSDYCRSIGIRGMVNLFAGHRSKRQRIKALRT